MWSDILIQVVAILAMAVMFLFMYGIPKKYLPVLCHVNTADVQSRRHFVRGAQFLARAKSATATDSAAALAKQAEEEADKAISLNPKDAAAHILKAICLDLQGFKTSALDSLNNALSPLTAASLSERERGDALFRRAEMVMNSEKIERSERVDSAIQDLTQAVKLSKENGKAFRLLGQCYEIKEMKDDAKKAYEGALEIEPEWSAVREALDRLGS